MANSIEEREAILRHSMLMTARILGNKKQDRWVVGTLLAELAKDDEDQPIESDDFATRLIDELAMWGFLEEQESQHDVPATSIRHRLFRLSRKGHQLYTHELQPHPMIWDSRTSR